jgi:hypothetical protein
MSRHKSHRLTRILDRCAQEHKKIDAEMKDLEMTTPGGIAYYRNLRALYQWASTSVVLSIPHLDHWLRRFTTKEMG